MWNALGKAQQHTPFHCFSPAESLVLISSLPAWLEHPTSSLRSHTQATLFFHMVALGLFGKEAFELSSCICSQSAPEALPPSSLALPTSTCQWSDPAFFLSFFHRGGDPLSMRFQTQACLCSILRTTSPSTAVLLDLWVSTPWGQISAVYNSQQ